MAKGFISSPRMQGGMEFEFRHNFGVLTRLLGMMASQVEDPMREAGDEIIERVETLYWPTYAMWEHEPEIKVTADVHARRMDIHVQTDEIYNYVDLGTKPHIIRPRTAKRLAWRGPFEAKTQPNMLGSSSGYLGDEWHGAMEVHHPGTQPRNFTKKVIMNARIFMRETIRDKLQAWAERLVREYMG